MSDNEQELEKRAAEEKQAREQLAADLARVMSEPAGRRVLEHIVYELGALQVLAFAVDQRQHAYNEGQRAVGVALNRELERADVDGWARLHEDRLARIRMAVRDPQPNKTDH